MPHVILGGLRTDSRDGTYSVNGPFRFRFGFTGILSKSCLITDAIPLFPYPFEREEGLLKTINSGVTIDEYCYHDNGVYLLMVMLSGSEMRLALANLYQYWVTFRRSPTFNLLRQSLFSIHSIYTIFIVNNRIESTFDSIH